MAKGINKPAKGIKVPMSKIFGNSTEKQPTSSLKPSEGFFEKLQAEISKAPPTTQGKK
jgi:hypothetical protein